MQRIGTILEQSIKRSGISSRLLVSKILWVFQTLIREQWGDEAQKKIIPRSFDGGVLTVEVKDAIYLVSLRILEERMIRKIQKQTKQDSVKAFRWLVR